MLVAAAVAALLVGVTTTTTVDAAPMDFSWSRSTIWTTRAISKAVSKRQSTTSNMVWNLSIGLRFDPFCLVFRGIIGRIKGLSRGGVRFRIRTSDLLFAQSGVIHGDWASLRRCD